MAEIGPNTRLRASPFYDATVAEGVKAFSPYNSMLMPTSFGQPEAEYARLTTGVSLWDVSVERQVQIEGPDAARCAQVLCTRDLSSCVVDQGKYVAMCDHRGVLINDPIVLKISETCYWLSIADNNILLWSRAIASERGFDVTISEPDVSPLGVQGPDAENVVASVFGDWVRDIRFFWFRHAEIDGIPVKVSRSGYSKQGGFEIYLMDGTRGTDLWNIFREAGAPWGIGPGNPNPSERIEGGMLSYGGDTDDNTNPFEVRLGSYVDLDVADDVVGIQALRRIAADGPSRHQVGVILEDSTKLSSHAIWYDVEVEGKVVGSMTCGAWSPKIGKLIGYLLVPTSVKPGDRVAVRKPDGLIPGTVCELPFV